MTVLLKHGDIGTTLGEHNDIADLARTSHSGAIVGC
jgi:hypothetical protein